MLGGFSPDALSDRINRRLLYAVAAVGAAIWAYVFFAITDGSSTVVLTIGIVLALVFHSFMYGPQAAFIVEQFSPRLRSTFRRTRSIRNPSRPQT